MQSLKLMNILYQDRLIFFAHYLDHNGYQPLMPYLDFINWK
jgi:hypothetical protein